MWLLGFIDTMLLEFPNMLVFLAQVTAFVLTMCMPVHVHICVSMYVWCM